MLESGGSDDMHMTGICTCVMLIQSNIRALSSHVYTYSKYCYSIFACRRVQDKCVWKRDVITN